MFVDVKFIIVIGMAAFWVTTDKMAVFNKISDVNM